MDKNNSFRLEYKDKKATEVSNTIRIYQTKDEGEDKEENTPTDFYDPRSDKCMPGNDR